MQMRNILKFCSKNLLFIVILNLLWQNPVHQTQQQQQQNRQRHFIVEAISIDEALTPPPPAVSNANAPSQRVVVGPAPASNSSSVTAPRMPPPRVRLNKCCHLDEYMDSMQACVAGNIERWVPKIWLINRKMIYTPEGGHPKFIEFEENVRPVEKARSEAAISDQISPTMPSPGCSAEELEYVAGSVKFLIFSNGSLLLLEHSLVIEPSRYCVDRDAALVCLPSESRSRVKVKKCCAKQFIYDAKTKTCVRAAKEISYDESLKLPINEDVYQVVYGFPECNDGSTSFVIAGNSGDADFHPENGHLQLPLHKNLSADNYCLEHIRDENNSMAVKIFACLHHFAPINPVDPSQVRSDHLQVAALTFGIVISVVFLAATLVASYLMPSVHHVLHWRCQIYYVFCLFVGDVILAYTQLSTSLRLGSPFCLFLASAMHFFFLSAFFWLNTMCFNIWWTFRDFRPSSLERNQELLRLRLYCAYAWGIPFVISVIAAVVNQIPETEFLRPGFGVNSCWFSGEHLSIFAYFFAPVGILLCLNIVLFISTTHQLTCGLWKRDDVKSSSEKTALGKVCLKLVVVMGVTWIADIISWLIGGPHSTWFFTDLINALQGVFIFIVVGCQPQVWAACKRFCCPRSRQEITNTTNGVQHSSSSQGLPSMGACGAEITQNTSVNMTTTANCQAQGQRIPMETVC